MEEKDSDGILTVSVDGEEYTLYKENGFWKSNDPGYDMLPIMSIDGAGAVSIKQGEKLEAVDEYDDPKYKVS